MRREDEVELPPELDVAGREVELAVDIVYINGEAFLHTIDRTLKNPTCVTLGSYAKGQAPTKGKIYKGLDEVLR